MAWRVLITGLSGFTGRHLAAYLRQQGHEVFGLAQAGKPVDLLDAVTVEAAIAELQPTHVAHLAGISFVAHEQADEIYGVNLLGTRNLLQALAHQAPNVQHVLLASSATVYGSQAEGLIPESAPLYPANDYAVSKLAMEYLARLWRDRLPLSIVRPFNYVGVGQSPRFVIPKIVAHFKAEAAQIELGGLQVWREYNDVRWVAQVYAQWLGQPPVANPVNLASGCLHSLEEVLTYMRQLTGHNPSIVVNSAFVRTNEVMRLGGDPSQVQALGFSPPEYTLEDTLRWMLSCA